MRLSLILAFLLALTACGSEPRGRPDESVLAAALYAQNVEGDAGEASVIKCQARELRRSDLTDEALWALAGKTDHALTKAEKDLLSEGGPTWQKLQICLRNH